MFRAHPKMIDSKVLGMAPRQAALFLLSSLDVSNGKSKSKITSLKPIKVEFKNLSEKSSTFSSGHMRTSEEGSTNHATKLFPKRKAGRGGGGVS